MISFSNINTLKSLYFEPIIVTGGLEVLRRLPETESQNLGFPVLIISTTMIHFEFKCCCEVNFNFIQILKVHFVS